MGYDTTVVDSIGASRGIAIAWNPAILSLSHFHASHHFIQASFHLNGTSLKGLLTNVYFPQTTASKIRILDDFSDFHNMDSHHY